MFISDNRAGKRKRIKALNKVIRYFVGLHKHYDQWWDSLTPAQRDACFTLSADDEKLIETYAKAIACDNTLIDRLRKRKALSGEEIPKEVVDLSKEQP